MPRFEHYCERCGQGKELFKENSLCPLCGYDRARYVEKIKPKVEKMGIRELVDN